MNDERGRTVAPYDEEGSERGAVSSQETSRLSAGTQPLVEETGKRIGPTFAEEGKAAPLDRPKQ